ncbi:hypothetical protein RN001_013824 [Aquatica leii]|uniref:SLC26A/SulP transporter domain-containing protein n=1 Tax=Aquatica leii TaxID=1421715 RepID=A0AAN7P0M0_9COLE|nr:hypothetical protein RN001_013824 [Aquatica leii]
MSVPSRKDKIIAKLKERVPIISWLPKYSKLDGIGDLISGITVGLTIMPQSMAYAALANIPPNYGLYSSFMGAFIYVIFGTIKEASVGPTSLMAILTLTYTQGLPVEFMILLTFLCGWVQLLMGIFKLGFLVDFISIPAVSGFTSATSVTIMLAQFKGLLGIRFTSDNIFHYVQEFYARRSKIRVYDLILGCCSIVILLIFRVSKVPAGLPSLQVPEFSTHIGNQTVTFVEMVQKLGTGIIVLPVVAILSNVAVAKAFTSGKRVDATQEMMTLGICNIVGSFIQSMPVCGAFTRSAVSHASGVRSPFAGIYAGSIILLALSFLTPYFYYIPKSTLAAVVISAVVFMIDVEIVPKLWKTNKYDLFVMLLTFIVSLVFSVEQGLLVGVIVNFLPLIKVWTRPKIDFVISTTKEGQTYLLVKPELGLYYSASEYFTLEASKTIASIEFGIPVVFDCKNILYVDYTSTQTIRYLLTELKESNRTFVFLNASETLSLRLEELITEFRIKCCENEDQIFNTLISTNVDVEDDVETKLLPPK